MIRLSELKLTLDAGATAASDLRAGCGTASCGARQPSCASCRCSSAASMPARPTCWPCTSSTWRWPSRQLEAALLARLPATAAHLRRRPTCSHPPVRMRPPISERAGGGRLRSVRHLRGAGAGADGLQADRARARQDGARTHQGHLGPVAQARAQPREQRAVRRRRRRHVFRRQAVQPDQGPAPPGPQGDERVRQGRRARGNPGARRIRTSAPSSWSRWWRTCASRSSRWAARSASSSA